MPQLSIITINLNNRKGLSRTIESVVNQTFDDYEYLIIDGGSTDGSVDTIKSYSQKLSYWISEPDKGIYHAMNKGIQKAYGKYCLFLNSGDCLTHMHVINQVFSRVTDEDLLYGNLYFDHFLQTYPKELSLLFFINKSLGHASTFIKTGLFEQFGFFDESLQIVGDWEFFLRLYLKGNIIFKYLDDLTIARFNMKGRSTSLKNQELHYIERKMSIIRHLPKIVKNEEYYESLAEGLCNLSRYENSKLAGYALKADKNRFVNMIKGWYHSF